MWCYVHRRAKIFSQLNRPRDPLTTHRNNFCHLGTPGREAPNQIFENLTLINFHAILHSDRKSTTPLGPTTPITPSVEEWREIILY